MTLDKLSNIRTVVNKTDQIDTTFRFFKMELMAGEENYMAKVKENGCLFTLDYSKVYWNSRLESEHKRVVCAMKAGEVVLDTFAGVGPFSIPAAKNRGCIVHGNDLNPHCYTYLLHNAKTNKVASKVMAYNLDGREFISSVTKKLVKELLSSRASAGTGPIVPFSHVIMNLPASAVQFLDVFRGLFGFVAEDYRARLQLPSIHCYCFVAMGVNEKQEALAAVTMHLGVAELEEGSYSVEVVRSVSPKKVMMRVTFKLPGKVAYLAEDQPMVHSMEEKDTKRSTGVDQGVVEKKSGEFWSLNVCICSIFGTLVTSANKFGFHDDPLINCS